MGEEAAIPIPTAVLREAVEAPKEDEDNAEEATAPKGEGSGGSGDRKDVPLPLLMPPGPSSFGLLRRLSVASRLSRLHSLRRNCLSRSHHLYSTK
jgi:hypothetical protein